MVIFGPSGVGKGTIVQKLLDGYPKLFTTTVSHCTRKPRVSEANGVAYFFISRSEFLSLIEQNAFAEYTMYNGDYYGTSKQTIKDQMARGLIVLLDIDLQGVKQMKAQSCNSSIIDARYVFIKPPTFDALEARLKSRGTETDESIQKRLARARVELEYACSTPSIYDKVIINDNIDNAFKELYKFLFREGTNHNN